MQRSVILISLTCVILCNCHCQTKPGNARVIPAEKCQITTIIRSGDTLLVKLEEFPGRGYSWQLKESPDLNNGIKFLGKTKALPADPADDSRQLQIFRFLVLKRATYLLQFEYKRPWEKNKPAAEECRLKVNVQ